MNMENATAATLDPPYAEVPSWLRGLHSAGALLLMVASLGGNAFILWIVVRNKELQYRSIMASMGAVVVNILLSATTNPQVLAGSVTGEWPFGNVACNVLGYFVNAILYVRWLNTFLIALDRFLYILTPFWYQRNSKPVLIVLAVMVWTVPFVTNVPSGVLKVYTYRSTFTWCTVDCSTNTTCYYTYLLLFTVYVIIGVLVPTAIYTFLYCYGRKKRREMNREMGTTRREVVAAGGTEEAIGDINTTSNGHVPGTEHYNISVRRPSTDLACIDEEDETKSTAMQKFMPSSFSESPAYIGLLSSPLEHKIINTNKLQNGGRRNSCNTTSTESDFTSCPLTVSRGNSSQDDDINTQGDEGERGLESRTHTPTQQLSARSTQQRRGSEDSRSSITNPLPAGGRRASSLVVHALASLIPSRQQAVMQRRERQATVTFAAIFTNLVLTQMFLFFLSAVRRQSFYTAIPIWVHMIAINLFLLAPALEPFIIIKNEDFKKVLVRTFRRRRSFSLSHPGHSLSK